MRLEHSVRFELTWSLRSPDLQSSACNRSATCDCEYMSEAESRDRTDDLLLTMQPLCQLSYPGGN
jgi:hypothetical protein